MPEGCSVLELRTINWMRQLKGQPPVVLCWCCVRAVTVSPDNMAYGTTGETDEGELCPECDGEGYVEAPEPEGCHG